MLSLTIFLAVRRVLKFIKTNISILDNSGGLCVPIFLLPNSKIEKILVVFHYLLELFVILPNTMIKWHPRVKTFLLVATVSELTRSKIVSTIHKTIPQWIKICPRQFYKYIMCIVYRNKRWYNLLGPSIISKLFTKFQPKRCKNNCIISICRVNDNKQFTKRIYFLSKCKQKFTQ